MEKREGLTRRAALGAAALSACALAVGSRKESKATAFAAESNEGGEDAAKEPAVSSAGDPTAQYGFLVNARRCINCGECVDACRLWSRTPSNVPARRKVIAYEDRVGREVFVSSSCMHCEKPACMEVCPAGAIKKGDGGIVTVDKNLCIGCKYCYQACPFEAPHYDSVAMDKCDYCFGAGVALGDAPHCVQACKVQALKFGKLDDLLAFSSWAKRVEAPTEPACVLV